MPGGFNPNINSNYISTIVDVSILDTTTNVTQTSFNSTFLPMKESGANTGDDNQLQFIASQSLLNALLTSFFRSELFMSRHNPYMIFPYIYYDNSTNPAKGINCTTALLEFQFPKIGFKGYNC
jgi:hypothetical protein